MTESYEQLGSAGSVPPAPPLGPLGPLGPIGPSLEAEEKALRKGKGVRLFKIMGVLVLIVGGIIAYLATGGDDIAYRTFGQNINGIDQEHFDQFWGCAFPGSNLADIRSDQDLRAHIHRRASGGPRTYGRHVRSDCLVELSEMRPRLEALIPPEEFQPRVREIADSIEHVQSGWVSYIAYLEAVERYDEEGAREHVSKIAKGWYDYRHAHAALNAALRERRDQ